AKRDGVRPGGSQAMLGFMRHLRVVAVLALASSCGSTTSQTPRSRLTEADIEQRSSSAVVLIEAGGDKVGTGFILDRLGIGATNLHVVAGESTIRIKLNDGTQYPVMQIAGVDPARDLALLKINPAKDLPVLKLGDSDALKVGDPIVAIGNPLGVF